MYVEVPYGGPVQFTLISIFISLCQTRNGLVCRKLHQVVLSWWVAAQCFLILYVEKLDVLCIIFVVFGGFLLHLFLHTQQDGPN
jgi:hypothetical protein